MAEFLLGLQLMGYGIGGVFLSLIIFYIVTKLLLLIPKEKDSDN